jgi:ketosteroid isomerase-like protein
MSSIRALLPLFVALMLSAPAAAAPVAVLDAFHEALGAGDRERALALLAPHATLLENGKLETKTEYASHHLAHDIAFLERIEREVVSRRVQEFGDFAIAVTHARLRGTFRGRDVDESTVETAVLRRVDGGWKVQHFHW